jgi:hypothetical protein
MISLKKVLFLRKSSNNSLIFQSVFPHFVGFCSEIKHIYNFIENNEIKAKKMGRFYLCLLLAFVSLSLASLETLLES